MTTTEKRFLEALTAFMRGEKVAWESLSSDEIGDLFRLSEQQHVFPMIFEAAREAPAVTQDENFAKLRQTAIRRTVTGMQKTEAFFRIRDALEARGLHPLTVKGILCADLYPQSDLRISSDDDLLVSAAEWAAVCDVLSSSGMQSAGGTDGTDCSWHSPDCYIETHRTLFPSDDPAFASLNDIFADVHVSPVSYTLQSGRTVLSMTPEKHLLYLLFHAYKHFIHSGFGVRQVLDIGLWAGRYAAEIDFDAVYDVCAENRLLLFAKAVFLLADQLSSGHVPLSAKWDGVLTDPAPMLDDLLIGGVFGSSSQDRLHSATVTLHAAQASRSGGRSGILKTVFPPRKELVGQYPKLEKSALLLPVVWGKRLIRYAKEMKSGKKSRPAESLRIAEDRLRLLRLYGVIE